MLKVLALAMAIFWKELFVECFYRYYQKLRFVSLGLKAQSLSTHSSLPLPAEFPEGDHPEH